MVLLWGIRHCWPLNLQKPGASFYSTIIPSAFIPLCPFEIPFVQSLNMSRGRFLIGIRCSFLVTV